MFIKRSISLGGFIFLLTTFFFTLNAQTNAFSDYDKSGPYAAEKIRSVGPNRGYDVFRPKTLGENGEKHAVITWGNGTGATVTSYAGLLQHLATHGFVVIASHSSSTGSGKEMADGVIWLHEENARTESDYYQKLNTDAAGATGHSQGGAGTIESCKHTDKITSIAPMAPATFTSPIFYKTSHVEAVMFIMAGANDALANPRSVQSTSWNSFGDNEIGLFGELKGVTHMEEMGDAGKFKKYVTAWFDATLNENPEAISMIFNSTDGALHAGSSEWTNLQHQNLDSFKPGNTTTVVGYTAFEEKRGISTGSVADILPFNARFENNTLIINVPEGNLFNVNVYDLKGAQIYHAAFSTSCTLPFKKFSAKGGYITTVKDGEQILLKRKMMITR